MEEYLKQTRVKFHQLTPVYPDEQIKLETGGEPFSTRIVDMIAPIGKGQRSLIVSPPKAGKTSFLKEISTGIAANYPDIHLMAVLIKERPEEVAASRAAEAWAQVSSGRSAGLVPAWGKMTSMTKEASPLGSGAPR